MCTFQVLPPSLIPLAPIHFSASQSDPAYHKHTVPCPINKKDIPFHLLELQTVLDAAVIFPVQ